MGANTPIMQVIEPPISAAQQQQVSMATSRMAPMAATQMSHEVTLGNNFTTDTFGGLENDEAPEDLYEDQFLHDLEKAKFVKIDDTVEMMVNKEDREIIFRKNGPDTDKCIGEYVMKLEEGELEQVVLNMMAIKEGIFNDVSLKSNGVELRLTKNCKEQFVATILSGGAVAISMISTSSVLFRKMIYILLYGILK